MKSLYTHLYQNLNFESPEAMQKAFKKHTWIRDFVPGPLFRPNFDSKEYWNREITDEQVQKEIDKIPDFEDVVEVQYFLREHPAFMDRDGDNHFMSDLWVWYTKINPKTNCIDDDKAKNTEVQVWMEAGHYLVLPEDNTDGNYQAPYEGTVHDTRLDCGGSTFEEALTNLAKLVKIWYGDSISV